MDAWRLLTTSIATACLLTGPTAAQTPASVPAEAEVSDVAPMPPVTPHRIYLLDAFGGDEARILDADTGKIIGGVSAASLSNVAVGPNQAQIYVAESIWTKGNRGVRQDMVSVYDGSNLTLSAEIPLPGRVYMGVRDQNFALSAGGKLGYVYNMAPSSSVIVVDLEARKVRETVETPGCALAFAFGEGGFSSLCGDGSLATVMLTASGPVLTKSKPFFDAENDPVFENSPTDRATGKTYFISYTGMVHAVTLGATPVFAKPWSLQTAAGFPAPKADDRELAWRPGGGQPLALHRASGRLFVLMHPGGHWSHKAAGTEVWVFDVASRSLIKRFKLDAPQENLQVSQDADPLLYATDKEGLLTVLKPDTGETVRTVKKVGGLIIDPAA